MGIYSEQSYDMVFWDNSLHHMMDSYKAVKKSYEILKSGLFGIPIIEVEKRDQKNTVIIIGYHRGYRLI